MTLNAAVLMLVMGLVAGLVSALVSKSRGKTFPVLVHLIVGVIGAFHGRLLLGLIGVAATSTIGQLILAGIGAVLFLYPLRFIKPS